MHRLVQVHAKEQEARSALKESEQLCEENSRQVSLHKTEVSDVSLSLTFVKLCTMGFRRVHPLRMYCNRKVACYKSVWTAGDCVFNPVVLRR
jgi:hypothetical protein